MVRNMHDFALGEWCGGFTAKGFEALRRSDNASHPTPVKL
jgi:hypothetical protein